MYCKDIEKSLCVKLKNRRVHLRKGKDGGWEMIFVKLLPKKTKTYKSYIHKIIKERINITGITLSDEALCAIIAMYYELYKPPK